MKTLTSSLFIPPVIHKDKLIAAKNTYFWSVAGYKGECTCVFLSFSLFHFSLSRASVLTLMTFVNWVSMAIVFRKLAWNDHVFSIWLFFFFLTHRQSFLCSQVLAVLCYGFSNGSVPFQHGCLIICTVRDLYSLCWLPGWLTLTSPSLNLLWRPRTAAGKSCTFTWMSSSNTF